jgi:nitrous oxide reductase accessory protein NosL
LLLCVGGSGEGLADNGKRGAGSGQGQRNAKGLSADQAAERVRKQTGGRVLRIDDAGNGYRVKVLTPAGEVREIAVPAARR